MRNQHRSSTSDADTENLAHEIVTRDPRALGKAISVVEEGGEAARALIKKLLPASVSSHIIGITGSPGAGKSTFITALIKEIRKEDLKVAVLAVDPTSPVSGGALLGDRIRMQEHALDRDVYIRSMANRGHPGGLALSVFDAVRILETASFDVILVETVGAGQSELGVSSVADTTVLVLMPGGGDEIQAIKSGIMEVADVFVVNKADLPDSQRTATQVIDSLRLVDAKGGWQPPVEMAVSTTGDGIGKVWEALKRHRSYLQTSGTFKDRRRLRLKTELTELVAFAARDGMKGALESDAVTELLKQVDEQELDVHTAAAHLAAKLFHRQSRG